MKQYWKKDIWFTVHAIERLIEEKDRKIFDSIDEGREKLKEYLAKGIIFNNLEPNKYYCVYKRPDKTYYTIIYADSKDKLIIITGYPSKEWEITKYKELKRK